MSSYTDAIRRGYGNAHNDQEGPPDDLWRTFSLFDVDELPAKHRAAFHAARAEAILAAFECGPKAGFIATPPAFTAAGVHAQLATAWATIADRNLIAP